MINFYEKGAIWPNWVLDDEIGRGSYGVVYRAHRENPYSTIRQEAAVKHISVPNDGNLEGYNSEAMQSMVERQKRLVRQELEAMLRLHGKQHVVSYEEHRIIERQDAVGFDLFLRMELLTSLPTFVKQHTNSCLSSVEVARLGYQIGEALRVLEQRNLIHRDIKPANIFVDADGDFKLGDFGTARMMDNKGNASTRVGTLNYMAPEVFKGLTTYDHTVDIYSLGIVLYRMLNCGLLPFQTAENPDTTMSMDKRMAGVSIPQPVFGEPELVRIVMKCVAFRPADRYQHADDLVDDLESWLLKNDRYQDPAPWPNFGNIDPAEEPSIRDEQVIPDAIWGTFGMHADAPWYVPEGLQLVPPEQRSSAYAPNPVAPWAGASVQPAPPIGVVTPPYGGMPAPTPVASPFQFGGMNNAGAFQVNTPMQPQQQPIELPMGQPVNNPGAFQLGGANNAGAFQVNTPMQPQQQPIELPVGQMANNPGAFQLGGANNAGAFQVNTPVQPQQQPIELPMGQMANNPGAFQLGGANNAGAFQLPNMPYRYDDEHT